MRLVFQRNIQIISLPRCLFVSIVFPRIFQIFQIISPYFEYETIPQTHTHTLYVEIIPFTSVQYILDSSLLHAFKWMQFNINLFL